MKFQKGLTPKNKLTHEQWLAKYNDKIKDRNVLFISEYSKSSEKIKIKFLDCGHENEMLPGNFVKGYGCKFCSGNQRKTNEQFLKDFYNSEYANEYEVLSEYNGANNKITVKHNCSYKYQVTPSKFINSGKRCPKCNFSKGEKHIEEFLVNHNANFETQYKIDKCRIKNALPFDFAIFDNDNKLVCLVEYQGEQHFRAREFFGGEEGFQYQLKRDKVKKDFCVDNKIPLIEIPYWVVSPSKRMLQEMEKQGITYSLNS